MSQFGSNTPWAKAVASKATADATAKAVTDAAKASAPTKSNSQFGSNTPWALAAAAGKVGKMSMGGRVPKYFAAGGFARGTDTVPAMLTPGEFIVNKYAANAAGPMLQSLNESKYPSMLGDSRSTNVPAVNVSTSTNNNSTAVYNYSLGFSINGSSSTANDIARTVIKEIKNIDSQRIRGRGV